MCGIAGVFGGDFNALNVEIAAMTATLSHRGPDAGDIWTDRAAGIALGHRRLAIIELSDCGAQPMHSACGRYVLTFNGEIYNHLELRAELDAKSRFDWRGRSDTETLLAGFSAWGIEATLKKTVGMFAIGLWDRTERKLTLARDRFGEKPLYYGWIGEGGRTSFVFGSELKALRSHSGFDNAIDRDVVALFLRFCYVPTPYSIYKNIYKLEPGAYLALDEQGLQLRKTELRRYWRYSDVALAGLANPIVDEREALLELEALLKQAVGAQLVADVPIGAFLSGGVDSSTVVALMQTLSSRPVETFTVGFEESAFNEAPYAAAVARRLGTEHHEIHVSPKETLAVIPELPRIYDEPFADSSQIPTSIICSIARKHVTVALSGDGGDELFGGYQRYLYGPIFWKAIKWMPVSVRKGLGASMLGLSSDRWNQIGRVPMLRDRVANFGDKAHRMAARLGTVEKIDDIYSSMMTEWPANESPSISAGVLPTRLDECRAFDQVRDFEHRMMLLDGLTYLPDDILTKIDRAAMAVGLETRVPLLDHRLAEFAWRLPLAMKIRGRTTKWALRQILVRHVPASLIDRPKAGFAVPLGQWLRGPLRNWADALLDERRLRDDGYFDPVSVRALWDEHQSGSRDWKYRLWNVISFQAWLDAQ